MTALNLNQIIFLMVKVVQICCLLKQKASQCLKDNNVKKLSNECTEGVIRSEPFW